MIRQDGAGGKPQPGFPTQAVTFVRKPGYPRNAVVAGASSAPALR